MTINMYVVMHKKTDIPRIDCYRSLYVGAYGKEDREGIDFCDDGGINISEKNKNYCELTGLYWMWKNTSDDIEGLCHYRRFFTRSLLSSDSKYFLAEADIQKIMEKYDVVMPVKRYYKEKVIDAVNIAPSMEDVIEMRKAIQTICPDYLEAYESYLNGNVCYLFNMFIMKKEILDRYSEWLFDLLKYIERDYPVDNTDPYRSRLFGFLSERLIFVWLTRNIPSKRIKEVRVVKTDESPVWMVGQDIKNYIRNIAFHLRRGFAG